MSKTAKRRRQRMPEFNIVLADFEAGMTNDQMSGKYDVALSAISAYLKKHSLARRVKAFVPPDADLIACLKKGMTCVQMSKKLGGTPDNISRRIRSQRLRDHLEPPAAAASPSEPKLKPSPVKHINALGISVPRIVSLYGAYEARP